ncbi:hypothetical protein B4U45_22435 [Mycobacterium persicum]|uniref:Fumarylacetoacetase n=3 Tax=Mycobacterium TaxID=1763 RepID=A0A2A3LDN9_MYCAV|nr:MULTISPECIES: fumarylacetoacetate hydrolase family protein [Mycobacterium]RUP05978.1 MAG: fumarylacetoacetate hydrolase family protein [Mycobacterium sp.]KZS85384.1 hypothetical protein A4G31_27320 [Mycobacterium persicum]MCQ4363527.1 fumarylacetoacetate hydrolase family protein [Mycobacterium gordonae]MDP7736192.1 fumarylacetoacetate hydrolase family protein [Mycobacterium paragordonae]MXO35374.1 fumarylacetoacetate hydrolase family protein [Mycobacterium kansasii]
MRLRVVGGSGGDTVAAWDEPRERWLPIADALARPEVSPSLRAVLSACSSDVVTFLAAGAPARAAVRELAKHVASQRFTPDLSSRLPFSARSLRPFLLSPSHSEGVARGMLARYAPRAARVAGVYERLAGRPIPRLRVRPMMLHTPLLYQGNHCALVPDGTPIPVPPYGHDLDFELELGFVVCHQVRDATVSACRDAIGGLVLLNDISLRDTQWEEVRGSPLGPVNKCKSFATAMSNEVLTADDVVDDIASLSGTVEVNGQQWCHGRADDFAHSLQACLHRACAGETVYAGELLSTGTLAGCSGIELGRLPPPGATVKLIVPRIGTVTNRFGGSTK